MRNVLIGLLAVLALGLSSCDDVEDTKDPKKPETGRFIPEPENVKGFKPSIENPDPNELISGVFGSPKIKYRLYRDGYSFVYDANKQFLSEFYLYIVIKNVNKEMIAVTYGEGDMTLTNVKTIGYYYYYALLKEHVYEDAYVTYSVNSGPPVKVSGLSETSNKLIEL